MKASFDIVLMFLEFFNVSRIHQKNFLLQFIKLSTTLRITWCIEGVELIENCDLRSFSRKELPRKLGHYDKFMVSFLKHLLRSTVIEGDTCSISDLNVERTGRRGGDPCLHRCPTNNRYSRNEPWLREL